MAGTAGSSKKSAKSKASTQGVREQARDLTIRLFRDKQFARKDLSKVVGQVLHSATEGVKDAAPKSQKSVLREVFGGLSDAVHLTANAGADAAKEVKARGEKVINHDAATAAKRVQQARGDFLAAVSTFSRKLTGEVRDEMNGLVAKAKRTAPKVSEATMGAVKAADGRLMELGSEAAHASAKVARSTIGGVMMAAGGMLEGLAEAISPRRSKAPVKKATPAKKKAPKRAKKTAKRKK